jgi:hypothetical protein
MKEYQQKHMIRTLVYSRVTIVILFLLIILLLRSIMELNDKRIETSKLRNDSMVERQALSDKVNKAQVRNSTIATQYGLETYIRTTYPVVKQGEGVIVIYDDTNSPVSPVREDITIWERFILFWNNTVMHSK